MKQEDEKIISINSKEDLLTTQTTKNLLDVIFYDINNKMQSESDSSRTNIICNSVATFIHTLFITFAENDKDHYINNVNILHEILIRSFEEKKDE